MGKRIFKVDNVRSVSQGNVAVKAVSEPVSSVAKPVHKKPDAMMLAAYIAAPVLVVGGCILGFMAFNSGQNVADVENSWSDIRDVASYSGTNDSTVTVSSLSQEQMGGYSSNTNSVNGVYIGAYNNENNVIDEDVMPEQGFLEYNDSLDEEAGSDATGDGSSDTGSSSGGSSSTSNITAPVYGNPMERQINWQGLNEINIQTKCWLYVPGTLIDYPVIQEKSIGEYQFLDHDFYNRENFAGCIVTPAIPEGSNTDAHLMILGHNMKNATMFGTLRYYRTESFYKSYPYIYLYYPDRVERWTVWSVYHTTDADIIYDIPYEIGSTAFGKLVKQINGQKSYNTAINDVNENTSVLTLSTCEKIDDTHKGRFVVNAVLNEVVKY